MLSSVTADDAYAKLTSLTSSMEQDILHSVAEGRGQRDHIL
jgi:hypothetical protein